jgi:predicted secreted protein
MDLIGGIVIFIISWWLSFFVVLPIGVKGQFEDGGEVIEGTEEGAPKKAMVKKKMLWATYGAVGCTILAHFFIVPWIANS